MSRKYLYFIIIAIVIFVASIFLIFLNSRKPIPEIKPQSTIKVTNPITSSTTPQITGNSILDKAEKTKDFNQCLATSTVANQDACLYLVAGYLQNGDACQKLHDSSQILKCQENAIWDKAVSNRNLSLCSQITDVVLDQSCIANGLINSPGATKADCAALPSKERGYCEDYFTIANDNFLFQSAKSAADCASISGSELKSECLAVHNN